MTRKEQPPLSPQANQTQNSNMLPEDEISLLDVLEVLLRKKVLIIIVTSVFTLLAIFYALSITPTYRATIDFQSSDETNLGSHFPDAIAQNFPGKARYNEKGEVLVSGQSFFGKYLAAIQSYRLQEKTFIEGGFLKRFADNTADVDRTKNIVAGISRSIQIQKKIKNQNNETAYLEMVGTKPEAMADFLNALAEAAKSEVVNNTKVWIQREIRAYTNSYSEKLENLHSLANLERDQKIKRLSENLGIAKNLGIVENNFSNSTPGTFMAFMFQEEQGLPLWYLYGQRALEEEIKVLKNQPLSRQHIDEATRLKQEVENLSKVDLSKMNFEPAIISMPSVPPAQPFEPDSRKIVVTGMVLGLIAGIVLAFLSHAMAQLRTRQSSIH